jgi:hypothetical protein
MSVNHMNIQHQDSSNTPPNNGSVRKSITTDNRVSVSLSSLINQLVHKSDREPRLIVTSNLHHRDKEGQVKSSTSKFVRILGSKEDAYMRKIIVGEEWVQLETAWIKPEQIGYLRIRNEGGRAFNIQPTPEQVQEEESRIVDVGYLLLNPEILSNFGLPEEKYVIPTVKSKRTMFDSPLKEEPSIKIDPAPMWMIHPHEHMEGKPHLTLPMFLRCRRGEVSVTIFALPN